MKETKTKEQAHNLLLRVLNAKERLAHAQQQYDNAYFAFYDAVIIPLPREGDEQTRKD